MKLFLWRSFIFVGFISVSHLSFLVKGDEVDLESLLGGLLKENLGSILFQNGLECEQQDLSNAMREYPKVAGEALSLTDITEKLVNIRLQHREEPRINESWTMQVKRNPITIYKFAQYAAHSYGTQLQVELASSVPKLIAGKFDIVAWDQLGLASQNVGQYVITASQRDRIIVVSFQGTSGIEDALFGLNDKSFVPGPRSRFRNDKTCPLPVNPKTNGNFYLFEGFKKSLPKKPTAKAVADLKQAIAKFPGFRVVIVGHSLGGARAFLFALHLRAHYRDQIGVDGVYTYGQPILGSVEFNNWAAACIGEEKIVRVVSAADSVPWFRYGDGTRNRHPDNVTEVWGPSQFKPDFVYCLGSRDEKCSFGIPCGSRGIVSHSWIADHPVGSTLLKAISDHHVDKAFLKSEL